MKALTHAKETQQNPLSLPSPLLHTPRPFYHLPPLYLVLVVPPEEVVDVDEGPLHKRLLLHLLLQGQGAACCQMAGRRGEWNGRR